MSTTHTKKENKRFGKDTEKLEMSDILLKK